MVSWDKRRERGGVEREVPFSDPRLSPWSIPTPTRPPVPGSRLQAPYDHPREDDPDPTGRTRDLLWLISLLMSTGKPSLIVPAIIAYHVGGGPRLTLPLPAPTVIHPRRRGGVCVLKHRVGGRGRPVYTSLVQGEGTDPDSQGLRVPPPDPPKDPTFLVVQIYSSFLSYPPTRSRTSASGLLHPSLDLQVRPPTRRGPKGVVMP